MKRLLLALPLAALPSCGGGQGETCTVAARYQLGDELSQSAVGTDCDWSNNQGSMTSVNVTVDPDGTLHWDEGGGYTSQLDRTTCSAVIQESFSEDITENSGATMRSFIVHWVRKLTFTSTGLSGSLQVTLEDPTTHQMSCTSEYTTSGFSQ